MNRFSRSQFALQLACTMVALAGLSLSHAQTANRSVKAATQPMAPSAAPRATSPAGLTSPVPSPGGLTSRFPSGLPSPSANPAGLPSPNQPNLASPGTPPGSPPITAGSTAVGGGTGTNFVLVPGQTSMGAPAGPFTALQIAQSFIGADANRDGFLTRAEAQRLTIMPSSFEDMDLNKDGILSRSEYEDGVR